MKILRFLGFGKKKHSGSPLQISPNLPGINRHNFLSSLCIRERKVNGVSFAVTVHNEGARYLEPLLQKLFLHLTPEDEIVVLDDFSDEPTTVETIHKYRQCIRLYQKSLNGNFSEHKNYLKSLCKKKYIFQIDADENINDLFLSQLKQIISMNPRVELFRVPRINTVEGLTNLDIAKWKWTVNDKGWINSPDYQTRIFKNKPEIKWVGKVHEVITGYHLSASLPFADDSYSLIHHKEIERQRKQNDFYDELD